MAGAFDISDIPVEGEQKAPDMSKSVLSPEYRSRETYGPQQIGGQIGGLAGSLLGPVGSSVLSGIGGAAGETYEQITKNEPFSLSKIGAAGFEEAAWDAGGNLVLKGLGKTLRFASDKLGFTKADIPDATQAAQTFLEKQGSSLPLSERTGSGLLTTLEGVVHTPATADIFRKKQQEISDALASGQKDLVKQFTVSPEFDQAIRSGTSTQRASGQVLQNFMKEGEQALSDAVSPLYKDLFKDTDSRVSTFYIKQWANKELSDPAALTAGQKAIFKELETLPPQVDIELLHKIRSRWLAENRDKYSTLGTEKDTRAVATISELVKKIDTSMDFGAGKTLSEDSLNKYKQITKTYREAVQGLRTNSVMEALAKNPEEVGGYLFAAGKETPILDLYKAAAKAGTLTQKNSGEVINALRVGYLDAMTHTPENMLKFAKDIEQNKEVQNTFKVLFGGTPQYKAIEAMNEATKKGLITSSREPGLNLKTAMATTGLVGTAAAVGSGYVFLLNPDQQTKIMDALGASAVAAGGLILSQRSLAKLLLDPQGAKAITLLSKAKDISMSPTAFTKLVVQPIYNSLNRQVENPVETNKSPYDIENIPVKD